MDRITRQKIKNILYRSNDLTNIVNLRDFIQLFVPKSEEARTLMQKVSSDIGEYEKKDIIQNVMDAWESDESTLATVDEMANLLLLLSLDKESAEVFALANPNEKGKVGDTSTPVETTCNDRKNELRAKEGDKQERKEDQIRMRKEAIEDEKKEEARIMKEAHDTMQLIILEAVEFYKKNKPKDSELVSLSDDYLLNWHNRIEAGSMQKIEQVFHEPIWEKFVTEGKVNLHNILKDLFDELKEHQKKIKDKHRKETEQKIIQEIGLKVAEKVRIEFPALALNYMTQRKKDWPDFLWKDELTKTINAFCSPHALHLAQQVEVFVRQEFEQKDWRRIFYGLDEAAKKYASEMQRSFELYRCMTPERLSCEQDKAIKKATDCLVYKHGEEILTQFISSLDEYYNKRNQKILDKEKEVASYIQTQVGQKYDKIMKRIVSERTLGLEQLRDTHENLVTKLTEIFFKALNMVDDHPLKKASLSEELKAIFEKNYVEHKKFIAEKAEKITTEIKLLVEKHRRSYKEKMLVVPKDPNDFDKLHEQILREETVLLKKILREKYPSEGMEPHLCALQLHCEEDFKNLTVEDEKTWRKLKEREEAQKKAQEEENLKRKARLEFLKERNNAAKTSTFATESEIHSPGSQSLDKSSSYQTNDHVKNSTVTSSAHTSLKSDFSSWPKAVLSVHFGLEKIQYGLMQLNGQFHVIPNERGEKETLNVVALTEDNVLIGAQVTPEVRNKYSDRVYDMDQVLSLQIFKPGSIDKKMKLMGEVVEITKELLTALILHRVKTTAEDNCQLNFNRVVIAIPMWFTIVQKRSMKDAASAAGFDECFFIGETTAAALCAANKESRIKLSNNIACIVVDKLCPVIAAYKFQMGSIKMISMSRCPVVSKEGKKQTQIQTIHPWKWFSSETENSVSQKIIRTVCKENDCKEFIFVSSSSIDSQRLYDEVSNVTRPVTDVNLALAILHGAGIYASNVPSAITSNNRCFEEGNLYHVKYKSSNGKGRKFTLTGTLFEPQNFRTIEILTHFFETWGSLHLKILECVDTDNFDVGTLEVPSNTNATSALSYCRYRIKFIVDSNGLMNFEVEEEVETNVGGNSIQFFKKQNDWQFTPCGNLHPADIEALHNFMTVYDDHIRNPVESPLVIIRKQLQDCVSDMESNLSSVQKAIVLTVIKKEIQAANEMLDHEGATEDILEKKLNTLTSMKNKYFT